MTSQRHSGPSRGEELLSPGAAGREIPAGVLDAVRDAVLAVGVRRTTLTDVARRAGVSRMTLYRMVPDVETLLLELLTRQFGSLLLAAEAAATRRRTARSRLVATVVGVVRRLPVDPLFRRILDVDPELLLPYLTDRLGSTQRFALGHIRRVITEGHADGSIRRGDPEVIATGVLFVVTPYVVSARLLRPVGQESAWRDLERGLDGWLRP